MLKGSLSIETVMLRQWKSETQKLGFKNCVDKVNKPL